MPLTQGSGEALLPCFFALQVEKTGNSLPGDDCPPLAQCGLIHFGQPADRTAAVGPQQAEAQLAVADRGHEGLVVRRVLGQIRELDLGPLELLALRVVLREATARSP